MAGFVLGLDLGQASDPSALCIVERTFNATGAGRLDCRGLKRWPLGTAYTSIVEEVKSLTGTPPLDDAWLVLDATGVGRPVVDMFREAGLSARLVPVMITAGRKESQVDGFHHVAKVLLISTLQGLLQQRTIQFPRGVPEAEIFIRELQSYRVKITEALNETFGARQGEHDDLVLAVALASWFSERLPELASTFTVTRGQT